MFSFHFTSFRISTYATRRYSSSLIFLIRSLDIFPDYTFHFVSWCVYTRILFVCIAAHAEAIDLLFLFTDDDDDDGYLQLLNYDRGRDKSLKVLFACYILS